MKSLLVLVSIIAFFTGDCREYGGSPGGRERSESIDPGIPNGRESIDVAQHRDFTDGRLRQETANKDHHQQPEEVGVAEGNAASGDISDQALKNNISMQSVDLHKGKRSTACNTRAQCTKQGGKCTKMDDCDGITSTTGCLKGCICCIPSDSNNNNNGNTNDMSLITDECPGFWIPTTPPFPTCDQYGAFPTGILRIGAQCCQFSPDKCTGFWIPTPTMPSWPTCHQYGAFPTWILRIGAQCCQFSPDQTTPSPLAPSCPDVTCKPCQTKSTTACAPCLTTANTTCAPCPTTENTTCAPCPTTAISTSAPSPTTANTTCAPCLTTSISTSTPCPTTANTTCAPCPTTAISTSAPCPTTANTTCAPCPTTANTTCAPCPTTSISTSAPCPTTANTTCAPCPTTANTTCAPCPTTAITTCTPCPTTPKTTEGPTVDHNLNWTRVGDDRFVRFDQEKMTFTDARAHCMSYDLDLYRPRDSLAVATYLYDDGCCPGERTEYYMVGARGDGTNLLWVATGDVVSREGPWDPGYYGVRTSRCLLLQIHKSYVNKGHVLYTNSFTCNWGTYYLCG